MCYADDDVGNVSALIFQNARMSSQAPAIRIHYDDVDGVGIRRAVFVLLLLFVADFFFVRGRHIAIERNNSASIIKNKKRMRNGVYTN